MHEGVLYTIELLFSTKHGISIFVIDVEMILLVFLVEELKYRLANCFTLAIYHLYCEVHLIKPIMIEL